jgi:hypothetical protein
MRVVATVATASSVLLSKLVTWPPAAWIADWAVLNVVPGLKAMYSFDVGGGVVVV